MPWSCARGNRGLSKTFTPRRAQEGLTKMTGSKVAILAVLCAMIAFSGCRREEAYQPLKLAGPGVQTPAR